MQGFGIQNRAQVLRNPTKEWNPESKFQWKRLECTRNPQSMEWDSESKTVLFSLTWGDSTGLRTASCYFSFIYLALTGAHIFEQIWRPLFKKVQLEGFFLLLTVSSNRETSALGFLFLGTVRSPTLHLYHSHLIKKLAHSNNKVSTLISNRATSVKVRKWSVEVPAVSPNW